MQKAVRLPKLFACRSHPAVCHLFDLMQQQHNAQRNNKFVETINYWLIVKPLHINISFRNLLLCKYKAFHVMSIELTKINILYNNTLHNIY